LTGIVNKRDLYPLSEMSEILVTNKVEDTKVADLLFWCLNVMKYAKNHISKLFINRAQILLMFHLG